MDRRDQPRRSINQGLNGKGKVVKEADHFHRQSSREEQAKKGQAQGRFRTYQEEED